MLDFVRDYVATLRASRILRSRPEMATEGITDARGFALDTNERNAGISDAQPQRCQRLPRQILNVVND
ncbi:hypothetical protein NK718_07830 [Alsobacter sp. SYSU M60028]|uniref:Uncharacterized protein n=1 Tax=Alsobacter ponti TaxID=2962936 RepID=A0ABT1LAA9_9HYPH|nr:hypothetical protein [Alsobacter ponti]MCP8938422.1 hypothetical protein [Alsobacter ponti]